jgi:hypothetical protein
VGERVGERAGEHAGEWVNLQIVGWGLGREGGLNCHYCLVSLMWMKIGSNDITAQVPGVS